jgi:ABC-type Na+ transport system ATPase subunit NatA
MICYIKPSPSNVYFPHSETLQFGARLANPDEAKAAARVADLVSEFELQRCLDIAVGGQLKKGISGG